MGIIKLFKCASKPKRRKRCDLLVQLEKARHENLVLCHKVAELSKVIKELQDTNCILENKLKSSFIPKILAESSENINSSLNHSEVTLSENQINADSNNSSESSNESYEKTETSNNLLGTYTCKKSPMYPSNNELITSDNNPNISIINSEILESDSESTDQLSKLENISQKDRLSIHKMPTPLKKPPAQLSTRTYEKLFDRRTGRLRCDKSAQDLIEKLRILNIQK
uniref:Uncharacterized protein n=1 Tax=Acrobeloides nanus TaxID=290746 RepID=A0A914E4W5_9BILA